MITTLFVTNIHCPSCVSYVQDILRPLALPHVDVSIVDHRIEVQHEAPQMGMTVAQELIKAAFDVQHVTTFNDQGRRILERDFELPRRKPLYTWPRLMSKAHRRHIENCNACQAETARKPKVGSPWSILKQAARRGKLGTIPRTANTNPTPTQRGRTSQGKPAVIDVDTAIEMVDLRSTFEASISIGGMTCASCSNAITNSLESLKVVEQVDVDLLSNQATVLFSAPRSNIDVVLDAIEENGYEAILNKIQLSDTSKVSDGTEEAARTFRATLGIEGMTCSSCVNTITEGVQSLDGVSSIDVNLVGNSASAQFAPREKLDQILETIDDLGYDASLAEIDEVGRQPTTRKERTIYIQIKGMYCEHCPTNITTALRKAFGEGTTVLEPPTLKNPILAVTYLPKTPTITARSFVVVIEATHEAFSASIYHPPTQEQRSQSMRRREQWHILYRLVFTLVVAIPTFIIGIVYMSLVPNSNSTRKYLEQPVWAGDVTREEWALFIMTTPVMFFGADIFHTRALKEIWALWRSRSPTPILRRFYRFGSMNLLISAGTAVAYFSSLAVLIMDATTPRGTKGRPSDTYFDSVTFLSFFILIGRWLEAYSKAKAGDAVALLMNLRPTEALLVDEASGEKRASTLKVSVDLLEVGDVVNVPHGSSPPADGVIDQDGVYLFDESSLTGESKSVKKVAGDKVLTGSVNVSQPVKIVVAEIGAASMLDKIVDVVRKGQSKRAPIERVADVITGYFVPVITLIAILTWIIWLALGESGALPSEWLDIRQGGWAFWSLEFAIAVFVVACPCGIGLAAPTALYVGGGLAAKNGILVQGGGQAFQEASNLDVIVFDKTGTLTEGQMKVTDYEVLDGSFENEEDGAIQLAIATTLEEASTHPIAKAIVTHCNNKDRVEVQKADIREISGQGMVGLIQIRVPEKDLCARYLASLGNQTLLASVRPGSQENMFLGGAISKHQNLGKSTAILALRALSPDEMIDLDTAELGSYELQPVSVFAIADPIRSDTAAVLQTLREKHSVEIHMCTGDNPTTAKAIASQLGIATDKIRAGVLPQGKAEYIRGLQQDTSYGHSPNLGTRNKKRKIVAFVGDGTNDTPALAAADVSIALSSGSDVAVGTASFILLNSDLHTVLTLLHLARRVFRRVKLNFLWAGVYNLCLVPVAAGVFFPATGGHWRLGPVWASAAMAASSVSVVTSSLALRWV